MDVLDVMKTATAKMLEDEKDADEAANESVDGVVQKSELRGLAYTNDMVLDKANGPRPD